MSNTDTDTNTHVYTAVCTAEDGDWVVSFPDLAQVNTWAPNLRKAAKYAREAVAVWFDVPIEQVTINLVIDSAADEIAAARQKREAAELANAEAAAATQAVVLRLAGLGLPDRDVATVIGLSHQRVHQLRTAAGQ